MKLKFKILIFALLLALPAAFFLARPKGGDGHAHPAAQKAATKYTCPMHPNYVVDKPGSCPICGMDLVPVEVEQAQPEPARHEGHALPQAGEPRQEVDGLSPIRISPEKQKLIGVRSVEAVRRPVSRTVRTAGKVAYDPDLYYAQQEYISSLRTYRDAQSSGQELVVENAKSLLESARLRLKLMGLGDDQIESMAAGGEPDKALLLARDDGRAWVYASVFESDIPLVQPGLSARISSPSLAGKTFTGKVVSVDPVLDPATRSVRARILAGNAPAALRPEVYLTVELEIPLGSGLVVPSDAVLDTGTRQVVFIDKGDGLIEPRQVTLGEKTDGLSIVRSGLARGEKVVTNANFLVDSESQLKATMKAASGGHQH